jgi:hypothetical protein
VHVTELRINLFPGQLQGTFIWMAQLITATFLAAITELTYHADIKFQKRTCARWSTWQGRNYLAAPN